MTFAHLISTGAVVLGLWITLGAVYRLFFHPLAKFPGPKLAAATTLYEAYHDVWRKGRFVFEFGRLHEKYGPIVRIGPNELHIIDPDYYHQLYSMTNRYDKYGYFYRMLGSPLGSFSTVRADLHRVRRSTLNPFFAPQAVAKVEARMQETVDRLMDRMEDCAEREGPVPLFYAFRCITVDVICEYVFGEQLGLMERPDWGLSFYNGWRSFWEMMPLTRQLPFLMDLFSSMPHWLSALVNHKGLEVTGMFSAIGDLTAKALKEDKEKRSDGKRDSKTPVICAVANDTALPSAERTFPRLVAEAIVLVGAGFETTGQLLSSMVYWVLANPDVHDRLVAELHEAISDPNNIPTAQELEKLPYLVAVVKESLRYELVFVEGGMPTIPPLVRKRLLIRNFERRLALGAISRLPRVNTQGEIRYKDWVIPRNTAVGMSSLYVTHHASVVADPETFDPSRWLVSDAERRHLEHYMVAFGRGTRSCLGINFAYAEMYKVMATMFRRFPYRLALHDTTARDAEAAHDYFAGMVRRENGRVLQVKITKRNPAQMTRDGDREL